MKFVVAFVALIAVVLFVSKSEPNREMYLRFAGPNCQQVMSGTAEYENCIVRGILNWNALNRVEPNQ